MKVTVWLKNLTVQTRESPPENIKKAGRMKRKKIETLHSPKNPTVFLYTQVEIWGDPLINQKVITRK